MAIFSQFIERKTTPLQQITPQISGATIIQKPEQNHRTQEAHDIIISFLNSHPGHAVTVITPHHSFKTTLKAQTNIHYTPISQTETNLWLQADPKNTPQEIAQTWIDFLYSQEKETTAEEEIIQIAITRILENQRVQTLPQVLQLLQDQNFAQILPQTVQNSVRLHLQNISQTLGELTPTPPSTNALRHKEFNLSAHNTWLIKAFLHHEATSEAQPQAQIILLIDCPLDLSADIIQTHDLTKIKVLLLTSQNTKETGIYEYATQILSPEPKKKRWILQKTWENKRIPFKIAK